MLAGCCVVTVNGRVPEYDKGATTGGHYSISSLDDGNVGLNLGGLLANNELKKCFTPAEDVAPLSIKVTRSRIERECHWYHVVNGVFALCTLTAWPLWIPDDTYKYRVELLLGNRSRTVDVDVAKAKWQSVFTPLGWVPALFADDNVFGEKPDEDVTRKACDGVACELIPIAVRSVLLKKDYDEYFADKWRADADAKAKAEDDAKARLKERETKMFAKQEELIRAFAVKDAPVIWKTVQDLRGQLQTMDSGLAQLKEALIEFDRDPDRDPDYTRICKMRSEVKANLDSLYAKLKDAYIAAKKYEATPGRKEFEERHRKTLEDGIREAEMATKRFKEMSRDK